jgi:hypothetical protein
LLTIFGNHPEVSHAMLRQAFTSRLAIGVLGANVSLGIDQILAGAVVYGTGAARLKRLLKKSTLLPRKNLSG